MLAFFTIITAASISFIPTPSSTTSFIAILFDQPTYSPQSTFIVPSPPYAFTQLIILPILIFAFRPILSSLIPPSPP